MPANTGCVCASTKPGITTRWPASITSQSSVIRASISRRLPTASTRSPLTIIAPSSMIESWRRSPPVRGRRAPASVTSCKQLTTARVSGTGFPARAPREERVNDQRENDQIDQSGCGYRQKRRAAKRVAGRARKDVLRNEKRPGVEVIECMNHQGRRTARPIEAVDQHQRHAVGDHYQKAKRD